MQGEVELSPLWTVTDKSIHESFHSFVANAIAYKMNDVTNLSDVKLLEVGELWLTTQVKWLYCGIVLEDSSYRLSSFETHWTSTHRQRIQRLDGEQLR